VKIHPLALGISLGLFLGLGVFLADAYSITTGSGESIGIIRWVVPGFDRNWPGAFTGLVVAFLEGLAAGTAFAWLYNKIVNALDKRAKK
jgi:hypothetical protein